MGYSATAGYVPRTFENWIALAIAKINDRYSMQYTIESFVGTNWYDILYPIIQMNIEGDAEFADVWAKLTEYLDQVNSRMNDPMVVNDGILLAFERAGFIASVRPMVAANAGKIGICIFADTSTQETQAIVAKTMTGCIAGGIVSDGDNSATDTLNNGQSQTWNWYSPTETEIDLQMTISYVNQGGKSLPSADDTAEDLRAKLAQRYRYGTAFAPDLIYQIAGDAPYALRVELKWSEDNGTTWNTGIRTTAFNEQLVFDNISVLYQAV